MTDTPSNLDVSIVPGQTPMTTPPFVPSQGSPNPTQAAAPTDDLAKRIMTALAQATSRRQLAATAVPMQVPGLQSNLPPAYMSENRNPNAWGKQRFLYTLGTNIKNAVAKKKQNDLLKAEGDWSYLNASMNELYQAQQSGDPQQVAAAQQKVDVILGDPKKLKNLAKALNQDWLNPEKTTVYGEALKNVVRKDQQQQNAKQQAAQGIQGIFRKLMQRQQQPQLTPDQQQQMSREIQAKAPTTVMSIDSIKSAADLLRAVNAGRTKYQFRQEADGTWMAFDPNNPSDSYPVRDAATGDEVKGKIGAKDGQVYALNGVPQGVFHGNSVVRPGDPDWTEKDAKSFSTAVDGLREKQFLRLAPEIAAQVGDPPNPSDYKKGRSDPEYKKALAAWGKQADDIKGRDAARLGVARARAYNDYRVVDAMDADGNVYYTTAKNAIAQGLSSSSQGTKLLPREKQMKDIEVASGKARDAIKALGGSDFKFSPDQIARLKLAMSTEDAGVARTEMDAIASQGLTDAQQDFVVWIGQLNERAMSLRNVAGLGQGAQDLRNAIRAMLPGIQSGSSALMLKQLDAFDNQTSILKEGIAHPGKSGGVAGKKPDIIISPDDMKNAGVP